MPAKSARWKSVYLAAAVIGLAAAFLTFSGLRWDTLPFTPGARYSDAVTSHLPAAAFLQESIIVEETFPVWRDTIMAGQPFAANPLNKVMYPPQWLAVVLPPTLHLQIMIALHLLIAGVGIWRWARGLGLRVETAAWCALAYVLAPRMIAHLGAGHLDIIYAMAWLPWVMESARRLGTRERGASFELILSASLLILVDVRVSLFGLILAAGYGIVVSIREKSIDRNVVIGVGSIFVVGILTAGLTLSLLAWGPYLSRAALTPAEAGVFSLDNAALIIGFMFPAFGVETMTYIGISVLLLVVMALAFEFRRLWGWLIVIVIAALYALGVNSILWTTLTDLVPGLLWFRVPARAWIIAALIAVILAGYGLDRLLNLAARQNIKAVRWIASAALLITFVELALVGRSKLEWRGTEDWLTPYTALAERLVELDPQLIYSPTYSLPQHVAQLYHLKLFGGVDPFQIAGVSDAIMAAGGVQTDAYSVVMPPLLNITGDDPATANRVSQLDTVLLGEWGVSHVISAYPLEDAALMTVGEVNGVYLYENTTYAPVYSAYGQLPDSACTQSACPYFDVFIPWADAYAQFGFLLTMGGFLVCIMFYSVWQLGRAVKVRP